MHLKVLSQWLADQLVIGHAARATALLRAVGALLTGGKLSLTHLGRSLGGTSLPHGHDSARRVTQLYGKRMQIEETFRDLKCHRWGFGLRYARCYDAKRPEILLLLGALATLVAWLVGLAGRTLQLHRHLQANTERRREVLSTFFIGWQLSKRLVDLPSSFMDLALLSLRKQISEAMPA